MKINPRWLGLLLVVLLVVGALAVDGHKTAALVLAIAFAAFTVIGNLL